jgi:hypothetical protein
METWIECAWFQCRKRFEPSKYSNQYYRADARRHQDALYCSGSCKQKAYRLRRKLGDIAPVTQKPEGITVRAPVTRPEHHTENKQEFRAKIDHARRSFELPEGYVYSDWKPWPESKWRPIGTTPAIIADDLTIPDFLRRQT